MNRIVSGFLDRLAERLTAVIAGVVSSKVESIRAETQAHQQSQLEDLARAYETDGKHDVARTLRERAMQLTSVNLAGDAIDMMQAVTNEAPRLTNISEDPSAKATHGLPDFSSAPARERRKKSAGLNQSSGANAAPESTP